jgi:DNA-directed RNA polymerase subunit E'
MGKIGITCRQPFLGAMEWIAEEIKKGKGGGQQTAPAAAKEKKSTGGK